MRPIERNGRESGERNEEQSKQQFLHISLGSPVIRRNDVSLVCGDSYGAEMSLLRRPCLALRRTDGRSHGPRLDANHCIGGRTEALASARINGSSYNNVLVALFLVAGCRDAVAVGALSAPHSGGTPRIVWRSPRRAFD